MTTYDGTFQTWDGEYEKQFYDVLLPNGDIVVCWPNAGMMHFAEAEIPEGRQKYRGKVWLPDDGIKVRVNREMNE